MENAECSTPNCIEEITEEWVYRLIYHICQLSPERRKEFNITSINIDSSLNSGEGALSDICHVSAKGKLSDSICKENEKENVETVYKGRKDDETNESTDLHVNNRFNQSFENDCCESRNESNNGYYNPEVSYDLFIKLIPHDLKELINRHGLFEREITFYRDIIPHLIDFMTERNGNGIFENFEIPNYSYGISGGKNKSMNSKKGENMDKENGIIILEDLSAHGYRLVDPDYMMLNLEEMRVAVKALAEFHGVCIAFDHLSDKTLVDLYPILDPKHLMWIQDDMLKFLKSTVTTAEKFISSIEGEGQTARKYLAAMNDPLKLYEEEFERTKKSPFKCLQHGDVWHNNCLFKRVPENETRFALVDWQICYYGNAPSDLCYLIFTTSSSMFRQEHLNDLLELYFDTLMGTVRALGLLENMYNPTYEQFEDEFYKSLKFCLLFCANGGDLILKDISQDASFRPNLVQFKIANRKTSIATDLQITAAEKRSLHLKTNKNNMRKREARAIRRKNFLDVCKEAIRLKII